MIDKGTCLRYYKRKEIQEALVEHAKNKEIGMRYGDGFGKRPDTLTYPRDVLELAMNGATSFHASEELWDNPLAIDSSMPKKELEELRSGWDLVLDIDCKDWEFSKLTTHLFIKALRDNSVKDISCKFSGNKGFHIGVPFQAFPQEFSGKKTKDLFPVGAQKIAQFLLNQISEKYITVKDDKIIFDNDHIFTLAQLKDKFGEKEFILTRCKSCLKKIHLQTEETQSEFICPRCEISIKSEKRYVNCEKCHELMTKIEHQKSLCSCGSNDYFSVFDPLSLIEVDTVLISSRHLYRMPYSLHEKSGLASLPIDPNNILTFEKIQAHPDTLTIPQFIFLDRNVSDESARTLLLQAWDYQQKEEKKFDQRKIDAAKLRPQEEIKCPITAEFFPPCINLILNGMEDGKKRSIFILTNYLGKIGWSRDDIEAFLHKWNEEKNHPPLREVYLKGQLHNFQAGAKLPPNCNNEGYYKGLNVCKPDGLCSKIKNPVNYTIIRWKRHMEDKAYEEEHQRPKRKGKKKEVDVENGAVVENTSAPENPADPIDQKNGLK